MSGAVFRKRERVTSLDCACATTRASPEYVRATSKLISPFNTLEATALTWLANSRTFVGCFHRGVEPLDGGAELVEFGGDVVADFFTVADNLRKPPFWV